MKIHPHFFNSRGLWTWRGRRSVHRPAICISEARIRDVPLGADPAANHDHLPSGDSRDRKFDSCQSCFDVKHTHLCAKCCWHNSPTRISTQGQMNLKPYVFWCHVGGWDATLGCAAHDVWLAHAYQPGRCHRNTGAPSSYLKNGEPFW